MTRWITCFARLSLAVFSATVSAQVRQHLSTWASRMLDVGGRRRRRRSSRRWRSRRRRRRRRRKMRGGGEEGGGGGGVKSTAATSSLRPPFHSSTAAASSSPPACRAWFPSAATTKPRVCQCASPSFRISSYTLLHLSPLSHFATEHFQHASPDSLVSHRPFPAQTPNAHTPQ